MIAGKYNFTGDNAIVGGKTFRRRFRFRDENGDYVDVNAYHFRARFTNEDFTSVLYLATTGSGQTTDSEITREPDSLPGTIELYIPDETMEGILHTQWTKRRIGVKDRYFGLWELEAEVIAAPGDTNPLLAGKVEFIREIAT